MNTLRLCVLLALFPVMLAAQQRPVAPVAVAAPVLATEADLSYKIRTGLSFTLDIDTSVDSGYGKWDATASIEVRCAKTDKQGTATISMTVQRYREFNKSGGDTVSFDTLKDTSKGEDEELTKVRAIVNKVIGSAYLEKDGRMHRVIWSEEGQTLWKEGGGSHFELLRDSIERAILRLPGKPVAVGTTWEEERHPIGDQFPFALKLTHKLVSFDPKSGRAVIELAAAPEAGKSAMMVSKMTTKAYSEQVVFDCNEGKLLSSEMKGAFKAVFGEGDFRTEADYDWKVKISTR